MIKRGPVRYRTLIVVASSFAVATATAAYSTGSRQLARSSSPCDTFKQAAIGTATALGIYDKPLPKSATEPCPPGSKNCIRTAWMPPSGTSKEDVIQIIQQTLQKYPKEDAGFDKGGWTVTENHLEDLGSARLECKSGIGRIAKIANGGKPFIDDLLVAVQEDGKVEVRSSSRKGYDDMGVNKKRLEYMQDTLPEGWDAPEPEY
jgi:uncharacterized protein (DUF1499 family)